MLIEVVCFVLAEVFTSVVLLAQNKEHLWKLNESAHIGQIHWILIDYIVAYSWNVDTKHMDLLYHSESLLGLF